MGMTHCYDDPGSIDGDPAEVALEAVKALARALEKVGEHTAAAERQLRNARMSDAFEIGARELTQLYPEAVDENGYLRIDHALVRPVAAPYTFWTLTADAGLITRLVGAIATAARLVSELEEQLETPGSGR